MAEQVTQSQAAHTITPELYGTIAHIVNGLIKRKNYKVCAEDAIQDTCIAVLRNLDKLDPSQNCFGYITMIASNVCRLHWHNDRRWSRAIDAAKVIHPEDQGDITA